MASDRDNTSPSDSQTSFHAPSNAIERLEKSWKQLHHDWTIEYRTFLDSYRRLEEDVSGYQREILVTTSHKSSLNQQLQGAERRIHHLERLTNIQQQTIESLERDQEQNSETLRSDLKLANHRADRAQKQIYALQELLDSTSESNQQDWHTAQKLIEAEKQISRQEQIIDTVKGQQVEAETQTSGLVTRLQNCEQDLELATTHCTQAEVALKQSHEHGQFKEKELNKATRVNRRLEKRLREKTHSQETEVRLQKLEICELETALAEVRAENSYLQQSATAAKVQQEISDCSIAEAEKRIHSSERRCQTLVDRIAAFVANLRPLEAGKTLTAELSHLKLHPERVCALSHSQFTHLTDCGKLLCDECTRSTTTLHSRLSNSDAAQQSFEFDECPWCHDSTWGWQRLTVPYSVDRMEDIVRICQIAEAFCEDSVEGRL